MKTLPQGWFSRCGSCLLALMLLNACPHAAMGQADQADDNEKVDAATKELLAAQGLLQRAAATNSAITFKLAADAYSDFLTKFPAHPESAGARFWLGYCYYSIGVKELGQADDEAGRKKGLLQLETAVVQLRQVLSAPAYEQRDQALGWLGMCYVRMKDDGNALKAFDELLDKHPKSSWTEAAMINRAQVLSRLERNEDALKAAAAFLGKFPDSKSRDTGLYTLGIIQHALKQYADAGKTLAKLLEEHKSSRYVFDAAVLLGQCQEGQKDHGAAAATYRKLLDGAPGAREPELRCRLAVALHNTREYDEAIKQLKAVLSDHPKSTYAPSARLQLGKTQYEANQHNEARKTLAAVVQNDKELADEARYWLAQCDISERKFGDALTILSDLAQRKPARVDAGEVAFFGAVCQMQLAQHDAAAGAFEAFRKSYAGSARLAEAAYHQAFCTHKLEQYDASAKLCAAVVAANDAAWTYAANKLWAENLFLAGRYDDAGAKFTALQQAAADKTDRLQIAARLGQCAYFAGRFDEAVTLLAKVSGENEVAQHAELRRVIFLHGDALLQTQQFDKAIDPLQRYVKLKGDDDEARYKLGLAQLRSDKPGDAIATFDTIANGKADSIWVQRALFQYGQLMYTKQKQADKAAPALKKVLGANAPADLAAPAMYLLAFIDFDAAQFDKAAGGFAAMIQKYPQHDLAAEATYQQGVSLVEAARIEGEKNNADASMQKTQQAVDVLQGYIRANADGKHAASARHMIGAGCAKLGQHDKAVAVLSPLAADPATRSDAILYDLAWSQRALDKNDDAVASYRTLVENYKASKLLTPARVELAELLYDKQRYAEAATLLEAAMADDEADKATLAAGRYRLGWCYNKSDQPAKEAEAFAAFAKGNPKHELAPSALYHAGMAYRKVGKLADAARHFDTLVTGFKSDKLAPTALLRLGETQADAQQHSESAATYKQFVTAYPKDEFLFQALFGVGWAMEQQKQFDEARQWYEKAIAATNTETAARAQFQIGETFFQQQQYEKAAKELLKVDIVYDYPAWSAKALYEAGQAFEQLKQPAEAIAQYERCVEVYKDQPVAKLCQQRLAALKSAG